MKLVQNSTIAVLFAGLSLVASAAMADTLPCGPRYNPNLMTAPAGATEISFSSLQAGQVYTLDRSEAYLTSAMSTGSIPTMNVHLKEAITAAADGTLSASSTWVCADLYATTPALNSSLLYLGSLMPALDGSIYSGYRRYQFTWPDHGSLTAKIVNDATIDPYSDPIDTLAANWTNVHLYTLSGGGLMLVMHKVQAGAGTWGADLRVYLKRVN